MNQKQVEELLLQSLEHEQGGVKIYSAALQCAQNPELKREWQEYLEQTKTHVDALASVCEALGIDAANETPGRHVVRHVGGALVRAMNMALEQGDGPAAELVACECLVLAETKDHADWQLLGNVAESLTGPAGALLKQAHSSIEDEEDEHLYHTKGWCRELWHQSLGLPAMLPPLEERQSVTTAIGAARADQASERARRHQ